MCEKFFLILTTLNLSQKMLEFYFSNEIAFNFRLIMTTNSLSAPLKAETSSFQSLQNWVASGKTNEVEQKTTKQFLDFFKKHFENDDKAYDPNSVKRIIDHASEQIYSHMQKVGHFSIQSQIANLERYVFAARQQLNYFDEANPQSALKSIFTLHNKDLLAHWNKLQFSEDSFWASPHMVDFIFQSHLNRFIRHADYQHQIEMKPAFVKHCGHYQTTVEPHLLMQGKMTPWSTISKKIFIDEDERLYSTDAQGNKKYWMYLDQGLEEWDRHKFERLRHFKILPSPPQSCQVQIVTSQVPKERWSFWDRFLKGTHHTHLRLVVRDGFEANHPESELKNGGVYSTGYGGRWNDVNQGQLLKTIPGLFYNPDSTEFFKQDLWVTTIDNVSDEKILKLAEIIKRRAHETRPFNIIFHQCCTETTEILKEAEVIELDNVIRLDNLLYKMLVPKFIRRGLSALSTPLSKIIPESIAKPLSFIAFIPFTLFFSPLMLLVGAWDAKQPSGQSGHPLSPLISKVSDLFDPDRFNINLTLNVTKWQKKQANTVYVKQN